jgi:hypothetical protein
LASFSSSLCCSECFWARKTATTAVAGTAHVLAIVTMRLKNTRLHITDLKSATMMKYLGCCALLECSGKIVILQGKNKKIKKWQQQRQLMYKCLVETWLSFDSWPKEWVGRFLRQFSLIAYMTQKQANT